MKQNSIKNTCLAAVFAALVFVITRFIQIPIPLGYFNVGNCFILTACLFLPAGYGIAVGSIGSALADLVSYPVYTIPTLIIKALMPLVFYLLRKKNNRSVLVPGAVSMLIPLIGYTLTGGIIYGNIISGFSQFPGLLVEYVANLILFLLFARIVQSEKIFKKL